MRIEMLKGTVSVRLDEVTLERLAAIAKATGRSRGALMSHAIERYVESEAWQVAAIQKAMDDLSRGDAGLVDHLEVAAWLDSWGTPDELDPPE
jgi:RHH-type rel operon transcriptional repressor/antitoxin RelB